METRAFLLQAAAPAGTLPLTTRRQRRSKWMIPGCGVVIVLALSLWNLMDSVQSTTLRFDIYTSSSDNIYDTENAPVEEPTLTTPFRITIVLPQQPSRRGDNNTTYYTPLTREQQAQKHLTEATKRLLQLEQDYPLLNMSNMRPFLWNNKLTPASLENLVRARQFRYFHQDIAVMTNANIATTTTTNNTKNKKKIGDAGMDRNNVLLHFLSHIPKTGVTFGLRLLLQLLKTHPAYQRLFRYSRQDNVPFTACDIGMASNFWKRRGVTMTLPRAVCTLWMSEFPPPLTIAPNQSSNKTMQTKPLFDFSYTLVRNPRHHVVSQYFHCTESKPHERKAKYMPDTLEAWLEAWVDLAHSSQVYVTKIGQLHNDPEFKCYDPRNMQAAFTQFRYSEDMPNWKDYQWNARAKTKHAVHRNFYSFNLSDFPTATQDLKQRFQVLGLTERLTESICLIVIRWTGWIPPRCDCTDWDPTTTNMTATNDTSSILNVSIPNSISRSMHADQTHTLSSTDTTKEHQRRRRHRRLDAIQSIAAFETSLKESGWNNLDNTTNPAVQAFRERIAEASRQQLRLQQQPQLGATTQAQPPTVLPQDIQPYDHGVKHHGATYRLSKREVELVDQLTVWDAVLYQLAQHIFEEQVQETQAEYGIQLCAKLRTDIDFTGKKIDSGTS